MSKVKKESTEVVDVKANIPTTIFGMDISQLESDAGQGSQNVSAQDMATPIISILQSNSPQCKKSDGKYIKGATEGMLFNNVTGEVYDGESGIMVVPCFFEKVFIEWKPNRGGLAGIHDANTPLRDQVTMVKDAEGKESPTLPNGNALIETNQHYVLLLNEQGFEPAVIAMSSSALKSSRTWNTLIKRVTLSNGKGGVFNPASFYMAYKLSTIARTKDNYSWFGWNIEPQGPVATMDLYNAGAALSKAVAAGAVKVKQEQVDGGPASVIDNEEAIPFD
mgnify:CR=1 FL=1